jgi:predicted  nucleic acid-binding Zn-ribbon protein
MNPEITIMIELQRLWDNVLRGREEIEKSGRSIAHWESRIREAEDGISGLAAEIMKLKSDIKQKEIDLSEKDEKARRLEERKRIIKTEKELNALEHEREALNSGRGALEDEILALMERLDSRFEGVVKENSTSFEEKIPGLSPTVRARFQKAIQTGNGKAIARVEGEICEACHVKIPFHVVMDAAKSDKIVNCSHCGRFIYR